MYSFKGGVKVYGTDGLLFEDPFFQTFHDGPFSSLSFLPCILSRFQRFSCIADGVILEKIFLAKSQLSGVSLGVSIADSFVRPLDGSTCWQPNSGRNRGS